MKKVEPFDPRDRLFRFDNDTFDLLMWKEILDDISLSNEEFMKHLRHEPSKRHR